MSAQTGSMPPPGPASARLVDRARFRFLLWEKEPNPLWVRELRQSTRLTRTPVFLTILTVMMTLLIAVIGGMVSTWASPATTGVVLFQVFFSLAYFLVTLIGPAVAANSIASEREGRTWEAVLLTGLAPAVIARGKFLGAFTSVAMYLVMLAPVAALPFLFGGVTAVEVVVAFAGLFLIALLAIAFGLAMSSLMSSMRAAIVITLLLAVPLAAAAFLCFGFILSYGAHEAWPGVPEGPPIWLPTAYERAPFDARYLVFLVVLPVLAVTLPAWFLYELTIANLTSVTDDRSSGLKRWFAVAAPALTLGAAVPVLVVPGRAAAGLSLGGLSALFLFFVFCAFLFAGDPVGPSRRVTIHWDRVGAGFVRRFLGPGVMRSAGLLLAGGLLGLGLATAAGFFASGHSGFGHDAWSVLCFAAYAAGFYVFVVGLSAYLRARMATAVSARVVLFAVLFAISVGPWIVAAIAGILTDHWARAWFVVATPSPFFAFVMIDSLGGEGAEVLVPAGIAASVLWPLGGLAFLAAAQRTCRRIIRRHEEVLAETERILAAEDAAAHPAADAEA
jgi:ABC-type transport system involved in multi-copper enzyme maturation permease subunit